MARQIIDTTTNNGSYIGDPAKTAFEKTNANFLELYNLSVTFFPKTGGVLTGDLTIKKDVVTSSYLSPNGQVGYRVLVNISDSVDGGYTIQRVSSAGTVWSDCLKINNDRSAAFASVVTAVSFNPTSTADVKDHIVGYAGDACAEIDRLVVINYKYRPEYLESDKTFIGLLQENVKSVCPEAANDSEKITEEIDGENVERLIPGSIDMMQILALNTRAHQQKNARIKSLESEILAIAARLDAAGI